MQLIDSLKTKIQQTKNNAKIFGEISNIMLFIRQVQDDFKLCIDDIDDYLNRLKDAKKLDENGEHKLLVSHHDRLIKLYEKLFFEDIKLNAFKEAAAKYETNKKQ